MPDIENEHAAGYLIGLLQEAGLMSSTGMGPVPISWQEIEAWMRTTQTDLTVWERLMVKTLSEEYVSELLCATAKDRSAPYLAVVETEDVDRPAVASKILSALRSFRRNADDNKEVEGT